MSRLALHLLGPPRLERDGEPVQVSRRKAMALLAYLAVTGQSHSRDSLATLLWPEYDQSSARADLRRTLSLLNRTLGEGWITADRETAGLNPDVDPSTSPWSFGPGTKGSGQAPSTSQRGELVEPSGQAPSTGQRGELVEPSGRALWLDVDRFRQLLAACESHGHPTPDACSDCVPLLEEAVGLYRDDFMAGFTLRDSLAFDEWQFFQTEGLRRELASALERLVRGHSIQGKYESAVPYARRWLALDPLHEPAHRHLMQLYAQAGQRAAALRQYRLCMRTLEEELGILPSDETTALYKRIRVESARPAEAEVVAPAPSPAHRPLPAFLSPEEEPVAVERPVFVARERELARLDGYLDAALTGQGQVVFVTGGPGRGKTALMHAFARQAMAARPDLHVAWGNCNAYSGVGDPYQPVREVLAMLTGDVEARWAAGTITREHAQRLWDGLPRAAQALVDCGPSLIGTLVPGPPLLSRAGAIALEDAGWLQELRSFSEREGRVHGGLEQSAIFEQVTNVLRALAAQFPLLLLLDDLQWADAASIGLLFHLGRRLEGNRILVACAYRPEEVAIERNGARHPLESALSEFRRNLGDVWVDLRQADKMEGRRFVDAFLDTEPNRLGEAFREALFQRAGGHPLFTVELLRAMQGWGDLVQDADGRWVETPALDWERLPARVEAVVEARVGRLEEALREVLAVASVEGERFTAQVVAQVQGIPERDALRALSQELGIRHRLVREGEEVQVGGRFLSRYQFAHALFQAHLHNGLSNGERRLLHGEIGATLEALYGNQTGEIVAQLAHHYVEAGQAEKAVEYSLRTGEQARLAYANEDAIAHFQRALALLDEASLAEARKDWRLEALKALGQIYYDIGELAEAEGHLREAIRLGREMGLAPRELVRLYHWLAEAVWWQDRFEDVIRIGEEGLALLGDDAASTEAVESVEAALMNDAIAVSYGNIVGGMQKWNELRRRTARFIERLPYTEELRAAYIHAIWLHVGTDKDVGLAMNLARAFEEGATDHTDFIGLGSAHYIAGLILSEMGDLHGAIARFQQALELHTRVGDIKHQCGDLEEMGRALLSLGDIHKAKEYVDKALKAARATGSKRSMAFTLILASQVYLCQGNWEKAVNASQKASRADREYWAAPVSAFLMGRAYLAQGDRVQALERFQESVVPAGIEWLGQHPLVFSFSLSGQEAAYDNPGAFRASCRRFREEHPETDDWPLTQWFLEPTDVGTVREPPLHHDEFATSLSSDWVWQDSFGDCAFVVQNGLEVHAANGRDLWHINLSAPRVLRSAPEGKDFAVQTVCNSVSNEEPAIGGLLLWKDKKNYLRLDRGIWGERDVFFGGCLENQDVVIGRGRLPFDRSASQRISESLGRVFLRLERVGDRVNALCSADGKSWFTVGHVELPVEGSVQVGLHAIGNIDRAVYPGAHPDGTTIRFESFQLWGLNH